MDLPAVDYLGYAINLAQITPLDIGSVDHHVIYARRLLSVDLKHVRDVVIDGVTYSVPRDVSAASDNQIAQGEYVSFPNGKDAASAFGADASYPLRYFAVSGTTSVTYSGQKVFLENHQYAFFNYSEGLYTARLRDYDIIEETLLSGLSGVPKPFDPAKESVVDKYRDFFSDFGSHIIHSANYGARYLLKVWASSETPAVNKMFNTNVKAKFNGIPSGGLFDATVKGQDQYKLFSERFQYTVTVTGGGYRSKLANVDGTYADYEKWVKSIKQNSPGLLSLQVIEVWSLIKFAKSVELRSYADSLYDAFTHIVSHPEVYKTTVTLEIQSDWAEFNLTTPGAVIAPDPDYPYPAKNITASDIRLQWGIEYSQSYQRQTLRFFILNDGSPIDFSTSRGSYAAPEILGRAIVTFQDRTYANDEITDGLWNTKWFSQAPVSTKPLTRLARAGQPIYTWDEVLPRRLAETSGRA